LEAGTLAPNLRTAYNKSLSRFHFPLSHSDDLTNIKNDMIAFIGGHGMRRFHGFVDYEEVQ
jgi:hypothetical protein